MKFKLLIAVMLLASVSTMVPAIAASSLPLTAGTRSTEPDPAAIAAAKAEFFALSKKEKKSRVHAAKKEMKKYKKLKKHNAEPSTNTLLLVILAILLPPLAVYLHEGEINSKFWLDLILTLLFYLPGMIYALIVVLG